MTNLAVQITPTAGGVGAYVDNVDVSVPLTEHLVHTLTAALGEHGVLFFRKQTLSPSEHVAFAKQFAKIDINRFFASVDGHPEIAEVRKEPNHEKNIGGRWHTDHTYDRVPALGSILVARELPKRGGDTLFSNMYAAYDSLSDVLKQTLEGLYAIHSSAHVFGQRGDYSRGGEDFAERMGNADRANQQSRHPVVIRHPISGRKALYVNATFTLRFEGWTDAESKPLLEMLYAHAQRPEFTYRFKWLPGSIAFWDNRASWHYALNDYPGERRLMHRVTLEGVPLAH